MKDLYIESTGKTPEINFSTKGILRITGNSYPENVINFYNPVMEWLDQFLESSDQVISLDIELNYINTSSTKAILNLIVMVGARKQNQVNVNWIHEIEDNDMISLGEDLEKLSKVKFEYKLK